MDRLKKSKKGDTVKKLLLLLFVCVLVSMSVYAQGGALHIGMVAQDPDPVRAGDVVEVRFKVENVWDETKYNLEVELVPEFPFSLYGDSIIKNLGRIDGREIVYFDYKLKVDPQAADGDHELTLRVHDGDEGIWELKDMFFIDIQQESVNIKPYIVSSDLITTGKSGTFTLEIANTGGVDVEALELELLPSKDYKLLSTSNYVYIGDVESDDTESEDFNIYVNKGTTEVHIPVNLKYKYEDHLYDTNADLVLHLLTQKEAKQVGLVQGSSAPSIIVVIIVGAVAIYLIRRYRRKR
jgi:hypothetical protein